MYHNFSSPTSNNRKELENISSEELIRLKKEIEFLIHKCLLISLKKQRYMDKQPKKSYSVASVARKNGYENETRLTFVR